MKPSDFSNSAPGKCIKHPKEYWAFIPSALPPKINYTSTLIRLLSEADQLLGELSGIGRILQNPYFFIAPYIRREAVSSSKIEGTQASLSDLFFFEASGEVGKKPTDVKEVENYVLAMEHGLKLLSDLPLSVRLVREIHAVLMKGVRGGYATPGELRKSQNWIGPAGCTLNDATFVPPPVDEMAETLSQWEKYLNAAPTEPPLVQCALMHYQFEAIHPFLDGNGRVGRLMITFFLMERRCLSQPLLYLSGFFDKHRDEYYARLLGVSQKGEWETWMEYFLRGVITQSRAALSDAAKIMKLHEEFQELLKGTKKVPESAHRLVEEIFKNPVISISRSSKKWKIPFNSVKNGVKRLLELGILKPVGDKKRDRLFVAPKLIKLFSHDAAE